MYGSKMKMHPLVRIPMRVCMMVYMVHLTNQMARKAPIPNIEEIMRQNPDIARSLGAAAMQNQMRTAATPAPPMGNPLAGFMQGMIPPGPPPAQATQQRAPPAPKPNLAKVISMPTPAAPKREMKPPPTGIAELLKSINAPPADGPKLPPPVDPRTEAPVLPSAMKKDTKKSTGKNSVVIKL